MKTSLFKKLIAITLSLTLIMSCMMIAAPHVHAADSIEFITRDGKRVGIKQITIDGKTYYDINGGESTIDPSEISPIELYKKLVVAEHNGTSLARAWANIASLIFESAGNEFGYNNNLGYSSNYDEHYTNDGNSSIDINVVDALSKENSWSSGYAKSTGWATTTTLKAVQDSMVNEICSALDRSGQNGGVSRGACIEYCTGSSDGFPLLNNSDSRTVLYNIATTTDYSSGSNKAAFSSFGLVLYDFELIPLADDDLAFITAAEGYESLDAAEADNAPGVKYNSTNGTPNTSFISNPSASDTTVSAAYSETSSTTVSNYMESSETYTFGQSTEVSTEFGVSFPLVADAKMSVSIGFSAEQAISTAYGTEESLTKETTTETVAEVNLPAHTQIGISQQSGQTEVELDYDCPVYFNYKVAIFGMNGEFYADSVATESWSTAGYDQGGICIGFGTDTSTGGISAIDNLYNRAIKFKDMDGFEESYGNCDGYYEKHDDGNASKRFKAISWNDIIDSTQNNGLDLTGKENVFYLRNTLPLSASGGTMSFVSTSMNTDITGIVPLYNLDFVQLEGDGVYSIAPGGTVDFGKIATAGFNKHNVPFYGYISDGGEWVLCNADGTQTDSVDGGSLDDVSNYQVFTGTKPGTYYAKFLIDETLYDKVDAEGKIKNSNLSSTPMVRINVTETGHDHICAEGPWQTTVAPTCTAEGEQHANCVTCGRVMYTQPVAKLDHVPVTITTPATCTSEGSIKNICGVCLGLISSETTEKLEHDEGVWKIDFEATADHHGQMSRYCTMCDTALESREFDLHTHQFGYESILREPTCVANGEKGLFCSICNVMYATEQIEKSGHGAITSIIGKEADCTHDGESHLYCTDCGELVGSNTIPAHGHTAGAWETVIEASCDVNGEKHQNCSICGVLLNTDIIEAHGHAAAWITVKEADCETTGREENVCTICDAVLETREIARTEHIPGKWEITKDSSCTQSGLMQQTCAICGALIGEPVVIDAHDHDNGAWRTVLEATCTTDGERIKECTICRGTIESEVIPALGHDDGVWTTALEASCETQGERHKNCTRCGQLIESERIDALGHTPGPEMTCTTDQVCLVCEEILVPADGKSHTWTEWETYKEAKFFTEEQQRRVCTSCDLEEYRFVKGTSKCHKYFPHCDGSGEDCWACNTLSNTNGFFRNLGRFIVWFFTENIVSIILFPFAHGHFHEHINLDEIFGSK
ncbi:MAG: aerolysin family beta-barrel pore-forming toxin [Clostridia bacterium]|nr:aerolysin family beta-barrel pore-forming toxin [Clostridia bacterium]